MHLVAIVGVVALVAAGAPPKAGKGTKAKAAAPVKLADAIVGDFVDYEVSVSASADEPDPPVVRLQATEVTPEALVVDVRAVKGRAPWWLIGGARFKLVLTGKAPTPEVPFARSGMSEAPKALVERERGGVKYRCRPYGFDASGTDGPKEAGCVASPDRALALTEGVVEQSERLSSWGTLSAFHVTLVGAGHAEVRSPAVPLAYGEGASWTMLERERGERLVRTRVSSQGGRVITTRAPFLPRDGKAEAGDLTLAGKTWRPGEPEQQVHTLLEALRALMTELPEREAFGAPGPDCTVGPRPVKTVSGPSRALRGADASQPVVDTGFARPEDVPEAPLPVRVGVIRRTLEKGGRTLVELVEWR